MKLLWREPTTVRRTIVSAIALMVSVIAGYATPSLVTVGICGSGYYSADHEAIRQEVNAWIRTNSVFDGLIDFDAAVRDPTDGTKFRAEYHPGLNANDWLHLNPAGYRALAEAIDLDLFNGR